MKNRDILIPIILFLSFPAGAQSDSSYSDISYFVSIHSGGLLGKKAQGSSLSVSLVQGVRHNRFALGVGVGYDSYAEWQTVPLFASVAYDLAGRRRGAFFVMMNTGYSDAWNPLIDKDQFTYSEEGGFFFHPLLGYRRDIEKFSFYFSAGYKFQNLTYEQTPNWWIWGGQTRKVTISRDIQRLSIQIGIGFR